MLLGQRKRVKEVIYLTEQGVDEVKLMRLFLLDK